jgi:hypothetical protein
MAVQWFTAMSRYPPLSDDDLRELYQRCPTAECRRLLWEIDRLHSLAFGLAEFVNRLDQSNLAAEQLTSFSALLAATDAEPAIRRQRGVQQRREKGMLQPPSVLGSSMAPRFIGPPERWQLEARKMGESRQKPRRR